MRIAKDFKILKNVKADGQIKIPLEKCPIRVVSLLNKEKFLINNELIHNDTVFYEDRYHDWVWEDGFLIYYSRISLQSDIIVIYEIDIL